MATMPTARVQNLTPIVDVGFYALEDPDGTQLYLVRWNRSQTHRYAMAVHDLTRKGIHRIELDYVKGMLRVLTPADALPTARALRLFAQRAPWDACMFCRRPLTEDLTRAFGMGRHCAAKHLDLSHKALEVIYRFGGPSPPDGGTPVPELPAQRAGSHLRLVAANGRLIGAA